MILSSDVKTSLQSEYFVYTIELVVKIVLRNIHLGDQFDKLCAVILADVKIIDCCVA
jgi:hypothetical protein